MTTKTTFETGLLAVIHDWCKFQKHRITLADAPGYFHEVADDNFKPCSAGLTEEEISFARNKYHEEIAEAASRLFDLMRCENFEQAA